MIFKTILVTGCCGDIARSIGQIARQSAVVGRLIGCDTHEPKSCSSLFDVCEVVPRADNPDYLGQLIAVIVRHNVDAVVPISDMELQQFLNVGCLNYIAGRPVIAANALAVRVGLDKLETNRMLVANGLPAPWTKIVGKGDPIELPCILKPRFGQGSKGVRRVNADEIQQLQSLGDSYIWQELILPDDQEYTSGVFATVDGEIRTIALRRQLKGGFTVAAAVVEEAAINSLLVTIARALQLRGSINVQLRLSDDGPKVFEINPRFSSTVEFRNRIGFRDFVWSLLDRQGGSIEPYNPPAAGTRLVRSEQPESQLCHLKP